MYDIAILDTSQDGQTEGEGEGKRERESKNASKKR